MKKDTNTDSNRELESYHKFIEYQKRVIHNLDIINEIIPSGYSKVKFRDIYSERTETIIIKDQGNKTKLYLSTLDIGLKRRTDTLLKIEIEIVDNKITNLLQCVVKADTDCSFPDNELHTVYSLNKWITLQEVAHKLELIIPKDIIKSRAHSIN